MGSPGTPGIRDTGETHEEEAQPFFLEAILDAPSLVTFSSPEP